MIKTLVIIALASLAAWAGSMTLFSLLARRPGNLGPKDDRLASCPSSPNCVCSQDADPGHAIEPLRFDDDPEKAWLRLQQAVSSLPRTRLETVRDDYLHAECTSLLFRFVDDLECLLDRKARVIHVRSASRAGHSDLGVNRARVEAVRKAFESTR